MRKVMFGLGESISIIGLGWQLYEKYKNAQAWETQDKLVDNKWLDLAKEKGVLEPVPNYRWARPERVETLLLARTHDLIYALDKKNKIKYRIIWGDLVLIGKLEPK